MLTLHITDAHAAFFSEQTGVDWNVIFLLLGMMVIASVLRQTGVFEYLGIWAAKRARGRPYRLMVMLCVITAAASALLDNVTTVLLTARDVPGVRAAGPASRSRVFASGTPPDSAACA
ncbi:SLC13 family permease [Actinomadura rudentiformis]|uniref:SLC13 family permease n=1 Tax=Actinomadura rudentiformis TaxID=359158 RepID=UPI0021F4AFB5|nr:SLC13 family permease [Actinomadura rudentiformis]